MSSAYLTSRRPQPDLAVLSSPALAAVLPRWKRAAAPVLGRIRPTMFFPSEIDGDGLSWDPEVRRAYAEDPLLVPGATAGLGHESLRAMRRVLERLDRLGVPTYVLHGEADPVVPLAASQPLADHELVTLPGLGPACSTSASTSRSRIRSWARSTPG